MEKLKLLSIKGIFTLNTLIFTIFYVKSCILDEQKRLFTFNLYIRVKLLLLKYFKQVKKILHNVTKILSIMTTLNYGASFI